MFGVLWAQIYYFSQYYPRISRILYHIDYAPAFNDFFPAFIENLFLHNHPYATFVENFHGMLPPFRKNASYLWKFKNLKNQRFNNLKI